LPCSRFWIDTEYSGHALKIASEISPDEYDAILSVSGDGILHELINGFAQHKEPMRAFKIPIVPIPAGSGNGTCLNLVGFEVRMLELFVCSPIQLSIRTVRTSPPLL
jgi:Diacylglycerol kinase catalytic domain